MGKYRFRGWRGQIEGEYVSREKDIVRKAPQQGTNFCVIVILLSPMRSRAEGEVKDAGSWGGVASSFNPNEVK